MPPTGCTLSRLVLSWVLEGDDIVLIPATKRAKYLGALDVRLTADESRQIDAVFPAGAASDDRYPSQSMQSIDK